MVHISIVSVFVIFRSNLSALTDLCTSISTPPLILPFVARHLSETGLNPAKFSPARSSTLMGDSMITHTPMHSSLRIAASLNRLPLLLMPLQLIVRMFSDPHFMSSFLFSLRASGLVWGGVSNEGCA